MAKVTLGLSTFVRNEIKAVPGLIESVMPHVDSIVVLDTGSADGTWEYLQRMSREYFPSIRAYRLDMPQDEKFHFGNVRTVAAHLNECHYVLMLDADERMTDEGFAIIHDELPKAYARKWYSFAFCRHNWFGSPKEPGEYDKDSYPDWQIRLILNNKEIYWRRAVHEFCVYGESTPMNSILLDAHIEHFHRHFHGTDNSARHEWYVSIATNDKEYRYYEYEAAAPDAREQHVRDLYARYLKRTPTKQEVDTWVASTLSISDIERQIIQSEEYRNAHSREHELPEAPDTDGGAEDTSFYRVHEV